jgi:DNA-directed RNA polymerase subunit RPC12/RpoP
VNFKLYCTDCDKTIEINYNTLFTDDDGSGDIWIKCPYCEEEKRVL